MKECAKSTCHSSRFPGVLLVSHTKCFLGCICVHGERMFGSLICTFARTVVLLIVYKFRSDEFTRCCKARYLSASIFTSRHETETKCNPANHETHCQPPTKYRSVLDPYMNSTVVCSQGSVNSVRGVDKDLASIYVESRGGRYSCNGSCCHEQIRRKTSKPP